MKEEKCVFSISLIKQAKNNYVPEFGIRHHTSGFQPLCCSLQQHQHSCFGSEVVVVVVVSVSVVSVVSHVVLSTLSFGRALLFVLLFVDDDD